MQKMAVTGAAGTGKTHLLIESVSRLLEGKDLEAEKILIITSFPGTAFHLRSRLENTFSNAGSDMKTPFPVIIHTVRSLCEDVLRKSDPQLQILSDFGAWFILRECIRSESVSMRSSYIQIKDKRSFIREMLELIETTSINSIPIDQLPNADQASDKLEDIKSIEKHYKDFCHQHNLMPPFDVIPRAADLLSEYGRQFTHIFVDQYEDFCPGEIQAVESLMDSHASVKIFVDSVLYDPDEIKDVEVQELDEVHGRLAGHVNRLLGKEVYSETEGQSQVLTIALEETSIDEAEYIARTIIKEHSRLGREYSDFAILCSDVERLGKSIKDAMKKYFIPCSGGMDISRNPLVQFVLLCLQAAAQPDENDVVLKWLSSPIAHMNRANIHRAYTLMGQNRRDCLSMITKDASLLHSSRGRLKELLSILDFIKSEIQSGKEIRDLVIPILVRSGAIAENADSLLESNEIPRSVMLLIQTIREIEDTYEKKRRLTILLDDIRTGLTMLSNADQSIWEDANTVKIMSIRESKGLEFPCVFIPGMVSDLFPARHPARQLLYGEELSITRAALSRINLPGTISPNRWRQHEKQLFYVAMTRAKEKIYITFAHQYPENGDCEPSPFLADLLGGKEVTADDCAKYGITYHDQVVSASPEGLPSLDDIVSKSDLEIACYRYVRELERTDQQRANEAMKLLSGTGAVGDLHSPILMENVAVPQSSSQKFSHTSIRNFLSCPRRYFLAHRLRLRVPPQPGGMQFGRLIHEALRTFHKKYSKLCDCDLEELWEDMQDTLHKIWKDEVEAEFASNQLQARSYIRLAQEVLQSYLQAEYSYWDEGRSCRLVEHTFDLRFLSKYNLTGRMDRIDTWPLGDSEIIDFKTSALDKQGESALKSKFLNLDDRPDYQPQDYQLPIYYYAGQKILERDPERLVIYQLRYFSKSTGFPFRRELEILPDEDTRSGKKDKFLTKADLEYVKDDILQTLNKMVSGSYPPKPRDDNVCERECDFSFLCDREESDE